MPIPSGWSSTDKPSECWRTGVVFRVMTAYTPEKWLQTNERITIKPGETGKSAFAREYGRQPSAQEYVFWNDF